MRIRMIQVTGQTIQRFQNVMRKTITHQKPCAMHVTKIVKKVSVFFFKYEWNSNQLKCNFKSIYVQILPFFQFHFALVGRIRKTVRTKNYILKTNLTFHSQIFSGRFDQNQNCRCLSLPFWVYHCFDCMHRMFYCSNKPIVFHSIQFWRNQVCDYQTSYVSHNKHVIRF